MFKFIFYWQPYSNAQTYDPTIEDAYCRQTLIDKQMSFIEILDVAGQRKSKLRVSMFVPRFNI